MNLQQIYTALRGFSTEELMSMKAEINEELVRRNEGGTLDDYFWNYLELEKQAG